MKSRAENMVEADSSNMSSGFKKNLVLVVFSILVAGLAVGAHNMITPDEPMNVGYVEIQTNCLGIDAGLCLGLQRQTHTTYNYNSYQNPEQGTENYYRRIESELMARAYNTCTEEMSGYDWTSEVSYRGRTAAEWRQNENIQLLPCEQTFYRDMGKNQK